MIRFTLFLILTLIVPPAHAGPVIDRTADRHYLYSMPHRTGSAFRRVGLLVVLPGKGVSAKLERDNWSFACDQRGLALIALDVFYDQVRHEGDIDKLHERIQTAIREVTAEEPSIDKDQIFLGGTSRGGMAALAIALRHPGVYKGTGVAAGALLAMGAEDVSANASGQHFFFVHGSKDREVPINYLDKTLRRLARDGAIMETFVHEGAGHILDKSDYGRVVQWMSYRMGRRPPAPK